MANVYRISSKAMEDIWDVRIDTVTGHVVIRPEWTCKLVGTERPTLPRWVVLLRILVGWQTWVSVVHRVRWGVWPWQERA